MGGSRIRSSINRRMYASYGFGALDFKRVIRLKLLDQMGRTLTRRKKVKRFFKASWSNPEKVAKSYRRRF